MPIARNEPDPTRFNKSLKLPFNLRIQDFLMAMQDVYDFFYDVNTLLLRKGLERLDDMTRPAIMSGLLSDTLTASLARRRCGYTRRVQVETGFSMIKRRQGESVAACIRRTQDQELRLMVLTHNLMISYAP